MDSGVLILILLTIFLEIIVCLYLLFQLYKRLVGRSKISITNLKILMLKPDSQNGIQKKEKLVSIYLTIVALTVALSKAQLSEIVLLASGIFLASIIIYFIFLIPNKENRKIQIVSGLLTGSSLSFIINYLLVDPYGLPSFESFFLLMGIVSISLICPYEESRDDVTIDKYELY